MDASPATLKISEKARKYHFLPRKSMFVLRNNSTASPLNAQRFATLVTVENGFENYSRNKNGREQVGCQTKTQRSGETFHRAGSEKEQNDGRHDRRDVRIEDRGPGMCEPLIDRRRWRLPVSYLFANALEDQYVRIHPNTDGKDHSSNSP